MDRALRYAAYAGNVLLLIAIIVIMSKSYRGEEFLTLFLMAIPPLLSIAALRTGPDIEERRLARNLNKARLRKELAAIEAEAE